MAASKKSTPKSMPKKATAKVTPKAAPKATPKVAPKKATASPKSAKPSLESTRKAKKTGSKATTSKTLKKVFEAVAGPEMVAQTEAEPVAEETTPAKASKKASTPKKAATPKKVTTPKKVVTPKKAITPKKVVTPKKVTTPKKAATPLKATTPKKVAIATSTRSTSKRKAVTPSSPAKKAKTGGIAHKPVPIDMIITDHTGTVVNLYELSQKTGIVIFTYPAASTPGCTKQVCFFRDSYQGFAGLGYKVFGLSNDAPKKNNTFYIKQKLNYPLLSDPEAKLIKFLGANNGNAHKAIRSVFILKDGKLIHSNIKVGPEPSKDWALEMIS